MNSACCPNTSDLFARSRLAAAPVSSSASITTRPSARCRPPANRSSVETSALRQHGLSTVPRLSSSFTTLVIAIGVSPPSVLLSSENLGVSPGQELGVVARRPVGGGHVGHHQRG